MRPIVQIVGDSMIDEYVHCSATRLNPEAPGIIMKVGRSSFRLGGAAAVAMLVAAQDEVDVRLATVVGDDDDASKIINGLKQYDVQVQLYYDKHRPTTHKTRFVVDGVLKHDRLDQESTQQISDDAVKFLLKEMSHEGNTSYVIQDYGKGVCTKYLVNRLCTDCRPVLVDPAFGRPWGDYRGCTLIKANHREAAAADHFERPILSRVRALAGGMCCDVVVTLGSGGAIAATANDFFLEEVLSSEIIDSCGAGDTVLAVLAVQTALGSSLKKMLPIAMRWAGEQVKHLGVVDVFKKKAIT